MSSGIRSVASAIQGWFRPNQISAEVKKLALASTAKVLVNGSPAGCGVLIGIDRLIVPLHVISTSCPGELSIMFSLQDLQQSIIFQVLNVWAVDQELDCAILQLGTDLWGNYPGCHLPFPDISRNEHSGPFVLSSFVESPTVQEGDGAACSPVNFCSEVPTVAGCSGGGYFDAQGQLFAIHLARATGECEMWRATERKALYLKDYAAKFSEIFALPRCTPICPPQQRVACAPIFIPRDRCFDEEGKAVAVKFPGVKQTYQGWEWRSGSSGAGHRGLTVAVPGNKPTYRFNENPHDVPGYNKDQPKLYNAAIKGFVMDYERLKALPNSFTFRCYGVEFTAVLQ